MSRVVLLSGFAPGLLYFRRPLLRGLIAAGHEVIAAAPDEDPRVAPAIREIGAEWRPIEFDRNRVRPVHDLRFLRDIRKLIRETKPDRLLCAMLKPNIYGGWAAHSEGVPSAAMVTGLGTVFMNPGWRRSIAARMLRRACRHHDLIFVQNPEDRRDLLDLNVVEHAAKLVQTAGEGIDLAAFPLTTLPDRPIFLMLARLLEAKGVREYLAAAAKVRVRCPDAVIRLAGIEDPASGGVPVDEVRAAERRGEIEYLGFVEDVQSAIADCSVCVLPSWYEGTPHSLLEGMSMGRAIITTDVRGCRETVVDRETGLLVPVRDPKALAAAMERLALDPELRSSMGRAGRNLAEQRFSADSVVEQMLTSLRL
jgi:glycosyltransferase involved in cell wall biosynthesis